MVSDLKYLSLATYDVTSVSDNTQVVFSILPSDWSRKITVPRLMSNWLSEAKPSWKGDARAYFTDQFDSNIPKEEVKPLIELF